MKAFIYNGRRYIRCVPAKSLFRSTMVHEVVNRGDVFAVDVETQMLTVIPGNAAVTHYEQVLSVPAEWLDKQDEFDSAAAIQKLRAVATRIRKEKKL